MRILQSQTRNGPRRERQDAALHKPGETVHLQALVFDDAGRAAPSKALKLTIQDCEEKALLEEPLVINRFGIANYDWKTDRSLHRSVHFEVDAWSDYSGGMVLEVRRYDLPEFAVSAAMDRGFYLDGQTPVVKLHAGYLFGKAVVTESVRVERTENSLWDQATKKMVSLAKTEQTATLDEHGNALVGHLFIALYRINCPQPALVPDGGCSTTLASHARRHSQQAIILDTDLQHWAG